jgi:hypothetical protein
LAPLASAQAAEPLQAPSGFRLSATNGYTLSVLASQNPKTGAGVVLLLVQSPHAAVFYEVSASVSATSIEANLGSVGRIDVDFVASGETRTERGPCGGDPVSFNSGSYVGSIDFEGEDGYSEVHATSVQGEIRTALGLICPGGPTSEGSGGHSPGARLTVRHQQSPKFEFGAFKNSPTRPAKFDASVEERRGPLQIFRAVEASAGPGAFDFDVPEGFGRVDPPAPFSGEATYLRSPNKRVSWHGDLTVDFPGRSDVRLTGAGTRAGMHRAVVNPGHPF